MAEKVSLQFRPAQMRKVNLLVPTPSIYNTLKPDGSHRKTAPSRHPIAWLALLTAVAVAAYTAVVYFNAQDADVAVNPVPVSGGDAGKSVPEPSQEDVKDSKSPVLAPPPQAEEQPTPPETKPAEIKQAEEDLDPLLARPVAKDATPAAKPKGVEAPPPSGKWAVRFGICVYKPNCDRMIEDLSRRKIEAFMAEGDAEVMVYKVMVGPYPTQTHADAAAEKFRAKKLELSPFAVDDQHYLGAASFIDPKTQNAIIDTARSLGYKAEGVSGKESRKVYKVYQRGAFDTKQAAEKALRYHKEQGLACIIERQD